MCTVALAWLMAGTVCKQLPAQPECNHPLVCPAGAGVPNQPHMPRNRCHPQPINNIICKPVDMHVLFPRLVALPACATRQLQTCGHAPEYTAHGFAPEDDAGGTTQTHTYTKSHAQAPSESHIAPDGGTMLVQCIGVNAGGGALQDVGLHVLRCLLQTCKTPSYTHEHWACH